MIKVVFEVLPLVFQRIECLIFNTNRFSGTNGEINDANMSVSKLNGRDHQQNDATYF